VADLFGGTGGVGKACRRAGIASRNWDAAQGPRFDLTARSTQTGLAADARAGRVVGVMLALPCGTFGPAGNRRYPMRTSTLPWGKPAAELTEVQQQKVHEGNRTLLAAIKLIQLFHRLHLPWILEHPHSSFAFKTDELIELSEDSRVHMRVLDQCRYRTPWRKRTRLLIGNIEPQDTERLGLMCEGSDGICHTGRRHVVLAGRSPSGGTMTAGSQSYPVSLCEALAHALTSAARAALYNDVCSA